MEALTVHSTVLGGFHVDQAVLAAYAWHQPDPDGPAIAYDFQQAKTLPENDLTRYAISPHTRKDLITRLLKLNHQRVAEETASMAVNAKPIKSMNPQKAQRAKKKAELIRDFLHRQHLRKPLPPTNWTRNASTLRSFNVADGGSFQ